MIDFKSNMMALAAKDASFTSAPNLQGPSLTPDNIVVQEFLENLHPNSIFQSPPNTSTSCPIVFHVVNPMVIDGDVHHHHDSHWLVDLAALQTKITQTSDNFCAFLDTLTPHPPDSVQPTMATTSVPMDDDDVPCPIGCQQPMANNNKDSLKHSTRCKPMDLLHQSGRLC